MWVLWALIIGLIAGFVARAVVPGPDPMGVLGTLALGLVGSLIGGFLGWLIFRNDASEGAAAAVGRDRLRHRRGHRPPDLPGRDRFRSARGHQKSALTDRAGGRESSTWRIGPSPGAPSGRPSARSCWRPWDRARRRHESHPLLVARGGISGGRAEPRRRPADPPRTHAARPRHLGRRAARRRRARRDGVPVRPAAGGSGITPGRRPAPVRRRRRARTRADRRPDPALRPCRQTP